MLEQLSSCDTITMVILSFTLVILIWSVCLLVMAHKYLKRDRQAIDTYTFEDYTGKGTPRDG